MADAFVNPYTGRKTVWGEAVSPWGIPREYWGTSSARYGTVSPQGKPITPSLAEKTIRETEEIGKTIPQVERPEKEEPKEISRREKLIRVMTTKGHTRSTAEGAIAGRGIEDLWNEYMEAPVSEENVTEQLEEEIANIVIEIDKRLSEIPIVLTDEEKEQFLQKAIDQITPYYDEKKEEIEAGIKEGKIRTAEDILSEIREVRQDTEQQLKKYKVWEAETEEEFVNTMADITATEEEDLEMKRADWRDRVREAKMGQVETGVLTSGIGRKRIGEMLERKRMETGAIQRRAEQARTEAETERKYDLKRIALAREAAERERIRAIGGPEEERATTAAALETTGYEELAALPSEAELARLREERGVTVRRPEALTELARERKRAVESRRGELETQEEAIRKQKRKQLKKKTLADLARKKKYMGAPILKSYLATV